MDTIKQAVASSSAIGVAPDFALQRDVETSKFAFIAVDGFPKDRPLSIIADARRSVSRAGRAFVALAQDDFRQAEVAFRPKQEFD